MPIRKANTNNASGSLLKTTCLTGLFLGIIIGGLFVYTVLMGKNPEKPEPGAAFSQLLFEYDRQLWRISNGANTPIRISDTDAQSLEKTLDRMEKKALSAENLLSVLKRRRQLAVYNAQYSEAYRLAAARAHQAYPYSQSVAAVAAEAMIRGKAIDTKTMGTLRSYLPYLNGSGTEALQISLHVLLGDFNNPQTAAAALPGGFASSSVPPDLEDREAMIMDAALINIMAPVPAAQEIQEILWGYDSNGNLTIPSPRAINFAAEYYYDFGDPLSAARLFSQLPDEASLVRQADALWLAGRTDSARTIWNMLTTGPDTRQRALYNLALTDNTRGAAFQHLKTLASLPVKPADPGASAQDREFGIIRYSRFLDPAQALSVLEKENQGAPYHSALTGIEILRRAQDVWERGKVTGAAWLLLEQYPDDRRIYEWTNWYFLQQRNYTESAKLLQAGMRRNFQFPLSEAILNITGGKADAAVSILIPLADNENPEWEAQANLARILEAGGAPARALDYYTKAAAAAGNTVDASRIQFRIAKCMQSLGRSPDAKRALEQSLELNPDNYNARLELSRLSS